MVRYFQNNHKFPVFSKATSSKFPIFILQINYLKKETPRKRFDLYGKTNKQCKRTFWVNVSFLRPLTVGHLFESASTLWALQEFASIDDAGNAWRTKYVKMFVHSIRLLIIIDSWVLIRWEFKLDIKNWSWNAKIKNWISFAPKVSTTPLQKERHNISLISSLDQIFLEVFIFHSRNNIIF